jgi:hypothetical protein
MRLTVPIRMESFCRQKGQEFFYNSVPSTCGAQWEDFTFEAHVDEQDIHISEGKDSRKGSTE